MPLPPGPPPDTDDLPPQATEDTGPRAGELRTDVIVVGGGMIGLTLACALAEAGITSMVIDTADPDQVQRAAFDGRATAIAYAPYRMLTSIGVWRHLAPDAEPITEIRVSDGRVGPRAGSRAGSSSASTLFLHFDHRELDSEPFGFMVENRHILRGLWAEARSRPEIVLYAPARVETLDRGPDLVAVELTTGSGTSLEKRVCARAQLVIGADGRRSMTARSAGTAQVSGSYGQTAIVATVIHDRPHGGVAQEFFLPAGPFAILPLTDLPDGSHRSSLVWTETNRAGAALLALEDECFQAHMADRFGGHLGAVRVTGPRWSYPLGHHHAARFIDDRLALAGDAAHGIHPIAGQGLNLGLRDVAALAEVLADGRRRGADLGAPDLLARYQRWRRFDSGALFAVTDGLNRLFSNTIPPLRWARDLGLAAVNRAPAVKRLLMRSARGTVGTLPRLLRGEAL